MLVLGIETSTPVSSVAIGSEQGLVASMLLARGRGHAEFVVPAVQTLCTRAEISPRSLAGIAVGLGPGLFTGMRVGVASAKAMAQALGIPIVGISSLDLLAFSVRYTPRLICACVDAKRREVFSAFYRQVPGGVQRQSDYHVGTPERLAGEVEARADDVLFVGSGALVYRERLAGTNTDFAALADAFPTAHALVELALPRLQREDYDSLFDLEPLYVRRADAEIKWDSPGAGIQRPNRVKIPKRAIADVAAAAASVPEGADEGAAEADAEPDSTGGAGERPVEESP